MIMIVYRMEHQDCETNPGHGPFLRKDCPSDIRPDYGYCGPVPRQEGLNPQHGWSCGVTAEQRDRWWSDPDRKGIPPGWGFTVYRIDDDDAIQIGESQVMFERARATRLEEVPT